MITFQPDLEQVVEPPVHSDVARRQVIVEIHDRLPGGVVVIQRACGGGVEEEVVAEKGHRARSVSRSCRGCRLRAPRYGAQESPGPQEWIAAGEWSRHVDGGVGGGCGRIRRAGSVHAARPVATPRTGRIRRRVPHSTDRQRGAGRRVRGRHCRHLSQLGARTASAVGSGTDLQLRPGRSGLEQACPRQTVADTHHRRPSHGDSCPGVAAPCCARGPFLRHLRRCVYTRPVSRRGCGAGADRSGDAGGVRRSCSESSWAGA